MREQLQLEVNFSVYKVMVPGAATAYYMTDQVGLWEQGSHLANHFWSVIQGDRLRFMSIRNPTNVVVERLDFRAGQPVRDLPLEIRVMEPDGIWRPSRHLPKSMPTTATMDPGENY